jgi:hypothetical protein
MQTTGRMARKALYIAGSLLVLAGGASLLLRAEIAEVLESRTALGEAFGPEKLFFLVVWTSRFVMLAGFFLLWGSRLAVFLADASIHTRHLLAEPGSLRVLLLLVSYFLLVGAYTSQYGFYNLPAWLFVVTSLALVAYLQVFSSPRALPPGPAAGQPVGEPVAASRLLGPLVVLEAFVFLVYSGGVYQTRQAFIFLVHAVNLISFLVTLPYMSVRSARGWGVGGRGPGPSRIWDRSHFVVLLACAFCARIFMILSSPDPQIDVFFVMQQAAQGLLEGKNPYSMVFGPSWYGKSTIAYLPATIYLAVPARLLLGDVRYTYAVGDLIVAIVLYAMAKQRSARTGEGRRQARCLALLYLFNPMALFILEQSWTDTAVIAVLFLVWFVWFRLHKPVPAAILLGIALVTKQYVVLVLPFLWRHPRVKPAHLGGAMLTAALLGLPLALWNLKDFIEDVLLYLVRMEPKPESLNLFSFVYHAAGARLPAAFALLLVPLGALLFFRQLPSVASLTGSCTVILFLFFFLIKQASLNYLYTASSYMLLWLATVIAGPCVRSSGLQVDAKGVFD